MQNKNNADGMPDRPMRLYRAPHCECVCVCVWLKANLYSAPSSLSVCAVIILLLLSIQVHGSREYACILVAKPADNKAPANVGFCTW